MAWRAGRLTFGFDKLTRRTKALIILATDFCLAVLALYLSLVLRLGQFWPEHTLSRAVPYFIVIPCLAVLISYWLRIPRMMVRSFNLFGLRYLGLLALTLTLIMLVMRFGLQIPLPRSVPAIFLVTYLVLLVLARFGFVSLVGWHQSRGRTRRNVLIYGAGTAGRQLQAALASSADYRPIGFIDDNPTLQGVSVGGLPVHARDGIERLIARANVTRIVLAMPGVSRLRRSQIVNDIKSLPCEIMTLPTVEELLSGAATPEEVRPATPDDLLGRKAVRLDLPEIHAAYSGRTVLVTGAGGSIGSELCRQVLEAAPKKIVLLDISEYALYAIELELNRLPAGRTVKIVAILGSVCDEKLIAGVFAAHAIDVVLHAAAYKHVPMVEKNEVQGVVNNVVGTRITAEAAVRAGVSRFILVSTDKAVRPTNVMGASKRLAELVIQDIQTRAEKTVFSMVRFGNVLGSSGSVIPLFHKQISRGGPVTVTHHEITRYFMTIPEAAQLVLLAGSFAKGGEVFVLDMGDSVKIIDLARNMIELSGLSVRDEDNPNGDIEIEVTGLRDGEKLYEELLIGENVVATPHPKIMTAMESHLPSEDMARLLKSLESAAEDGAPERIRALLKEAVDGYHAEIRV